MTEKDSARKAETLARLSRQEHARFLRILAGIFRGNFNAFQKGDQTKILVINDFWQFSNNGNLEIVIPGETSGKIDYSIVFLRLLKEIKRARATDDFETGRFKIIPKVKSPAIDDFKRKNPGEKLICEYMRFDLKTKAGDSERYILRERFIDSKTSRPLAETWTGFVLR